jgi:RNA polymerase sigma factor (sigma-70 family)
VILGDVAMAEDAAQAAWSKALERGHQLRDPNRVRSWLIAVAANEARQLIRHQRRDQSGTPPGRYGIEADPELLDLSAVLERLTPDERRLLALRYSLEMNSTEIAEVLGISPGAVRQRLLRLLTRMKEELSG